MATLLSPQPLASGQMLRCCPSLLLSCELISLELHITSPTTPAPQADPLNPGLISSDADSVQRLMQGSWWHRNQSQIEASLQGLGSAPIYLPTYLLSSISQSMVSFYLSAIRVLYFSIHSAIHLSSICTLERSGRGVELAYTQSQ